MAQPKRRKPSINDHFRREWLWRGAVWLIVMVLGALMAWLVPLWQGQ